MSIYFSASLTYYYCWSSESVKLETSVFIYVKKKLLFSEADYVWLLSNINAVKFKARDGKLHT